MKSETPRTDAATHADVASTWINTGGEVKRMVLLDFARQLETELNEAKSQVNELNSLLRHVGWGQGEIDSASSLVMELEESQAREAQLREALEVCRLTFTNLEKLGGYRSHDSQGIESNLPPNMVLHAVIVASKALTAK